VVTGSAADLLGAGVLGREEAQPGAREWRGYLERRLLEDLRDAEIEQLRMTVGRNENVRRLEITVHDEPAVRIVHGVRDSAEERKPFLDREPVTVAVLVYRLSFDVLHDQVRPAVGRDAAIVQSSDVRMIERGEDLALGFEPAAHFVGIHPGTHDLDRDGSPELSVVAFGEIHDAHTAAADLARETVGSDARAGPVHLEK
jgi:hypothetical protein